VSRRTEARVRAGKHDRFKYAFVRLHSTHLLYPAISHMYGDYWIYIWHVRELTLQIG